jgi:hypothetical protein
VYIDDLLAESHAKNLNTLFGGLPWRNNLIDLNYRNGMWSLAA